MQKKGDEGRKEGRKKAREKKKKKILAMLEH